MKPIILIVLLLASCEPDSSRLVSFSDRFDRISTSAYQLGAEDVTSEILKMEINGDSIDVMTAKRRCIDRMKEHCVWGKWIENE